MNVHRQQQISLLVSLLLISPLLRSAATAAEPTSDQLAFFEAKVRPLVVEHCYECHSAEAEE